MNPRLTRPRSILWFERLYFAAILLRALNLSLAWPVFRSRLRADYPDWPNAAVLLLAAIVLIVQLTLGWLAARRRSRVAAVLILFWILYVVVTFVADLARNGFGLGRHMLVADLVVLLAVAAMVMLLLPESRRWLSGRPGLSDLERDFS
jgi:hypothetical protein